LTDKKIIEDQLSEKEVEAIMEKYDTESGIRKL